MSRTPASDPGAHALGSYLRTLRESQGWSRDALAQQVGKSPRQLQNWENGQSDIPAATLSHLLQMLGGSFVQAMLLLATSPPTPDHGQQLAHQWVALTRLRAQAVAQPEEPTSWATTGLARLPPEHQESLAELCHVLSPDALRQLIRFGQFLREEEV